MPVLGINSLNDFLDKFANLDVLRTAWPFLRSGLRNTVLLVVATTGLALVLGAVVVVLRTHRSRFLKGAAIAYIDVMRALPPLVVLMAVFYVLPGLGLPSLSPFQAASLSLGFIQAAFVGEIYRTGVVAIDRGQVEAAYSVGLNRLQTLRLVLIPQVVRVTIPPLTNQATQITRDTALAFFIAYPELLKQARTAVNISHNMTPLTAAALMYAMMLIALQTLSGRVERRFYSEATV